MNNEQLKKLAHKKAREAFVKIDDEAKDVGDAERILKETLANALDTAMAEVEKEFSNLKRSADTATECVCDCEAQLTVALEALKWYANLNKWSWGNRQVAREALDKVKEMEGDKP